MKQKLFLCSSFSDVVHIFPYNLLTPIKGKNVAFIPTASIHEEYTQYVEDGKKALISLGLVVKELEITKCNIKEVIQVFNDSDCIYISGGNTFFLLQELKKAGIDKLIKEQVANGKLYIGESAGAIIASPNVEYAKKMDDYISLTPSFTDFTGLGLVDFYTVPHFNSFPFVKETCDMMQAYSHLALKPINNLQAIEVVERTSFIHGNE